MSSHGCSVRYKTVVGVDGVVAVVVAVSCHDQHYFQRQPSPVCTELQCSVMMLLDDQSPASQPANLGHNVAMGNLNRQHTLGLFSQEMSLGSFISKLLIDRKYHSTEK